MTSGMMEKCVVGTSVGCREGKRGADKRVEDSRAGCRRRCKLGAGCRMQGAGAGFKYQGRMQTDVQVAGAAG